MTLLQKIKSSFLIKNILLALALSIVAFIIVSVSLRVITRHGQRHAVPDFTDMTIAQALSASTDMELKLEAIDSLYVASKTKGIVLDQYPKAGNHVKKGRRVFLTTNSFKAKVVPIPYVAGFSLRQAKNKIVGSGFKIKNISYKADIATNNVLKQYYNGELVSSGSRLMGEVGSGISLQVGLNPVDPNPIVPVILGLTVAQAQNKLWESGFNIGVIDYDNNISSSDVESPDIKVYTQSIMGGTTAMFGRSISVVMTKDLSKLQKSLVSNTKAFNNYKYQQAQLDSIKKDADTLSVNN